LYGVCRMLDEADSRLLPQVAEVFVPFLQGVERLLMPRDISYEHGLVSVDRFSVAREYRDVGRSGQSGFQQRGCRDWAERLGRLTGYDRDR
jgi:hypothetical protein